MAMVPVPAKFAEVAPSRSCSGFHQNGNQRFKPLLHVVWQLRQVLYNPFFNKNCECHSVIYPISGFMSIIKYYTIKDDRINSNLPVFHLY